MCAVCYIYSPPPNEIATAQLEKRQKRCKDHDTTKQRFQDHQLTSLMKRRPADEGARHEEVRVCQGECGKAGVIIACVNVALVIVVAVVDGRGYGGVYY